MLDFTLSRCLKVGIVPVFRCGVFVVAVIGFVKLATRLGAPTVLVDNLLILEFFLGGFVIDGLQLCFCSGADVLRLRGNSPASLASCTV